MADIDPIELRRVLENPAFKTVVARVKDGIARKVMHQNTTDEEAADHRREYRAIERIMAALENATAP